MIFEAMQQEQHYKLQFTPGPVMKSENVIGKHEKKTSQLRKETEGSATGEKTSRTVL